MRPGQINLKSSSIRISVISCCFIFIFLSGILCTSVCSQLHPGEAVITLPSGKRKSVFFPHHTHQKVLGDCAICHSVFPMETSAISKLIQEGSLKKKRVMNQCKGCHKKMATANKKTGPVSCKSCHTGIR